MNDEEMPKIHPARFVYEFLDYVDTVGIYDYFDPEENMMVTSDDVQELIAMARASVPERLANDEAAERMRNLTDVERNALINDDIENVVIDMRDEFTEKMATNKGARGLLEQLVAAQERGDILEAKKLMSLAKEFTER